MKTLRQALLLYLLCTLVFGLLYPAAITLLAMPFRGPVHPVGQEFTEPGYFWGRLSATAPVAYNAASSGGFNLGPLSQKLADAQSARIQALHQADPGNRTLIPVDLVTASSSGLDPDISPEAAAYQVDRVARARGLSPDQVRQLVSRHTEGRQWGLFGEPRVHVLPLNQDLDRF